jgi:hypothetical protein
MLYASSIGTFLPKIPEKLAAGGFCEIGFPHTNELSLMTKTISKSSVATARNDIGYITE